MRSTGINGIGEPRFPVAEVEPGCIARFGVDDDMTVLVIANVPSTFMTGNGEVAARSLLFYGCFCDEPGSWEDQRLFKQEFELSETLTVIMAP